ncbi:two-component system sensor histidine kinase CreC [Lysobacter sp. KIS68-7]|uniref:two-component system sensor histidine kinase CreC n=1 Tax=Lysobacter sp. KIS68-7 TaxID=2904252 RepID=UPI001E51ED51|nr:two-component system sensor histidine kinase CreC [Lysobacter sp. KIS68-7]UHQ18344.1 two-component system sensor histidine kinase CreC [Lysobacter sp. KIS68-7]
MRIGLRIFLGYFAIVALCALLLARVFVTEMKPGVRQAMEDTLVDTSNVLAELATDDFLAGYIADGRFATRVKELKGRDFGAEIWGFGKRAANYRIYVTDAHGIVVYDSDGRDIGKDYSRWNDVYRTLRGQYGARSTRSDPNDDASTVMHVAAPLRDASGKIVGVLTVAKPNQALAPFIARSQRTVMRWGWVLMGTALAIGVLMAWWMSRQLGDLRRYANAVTAGERASPPKSTGEFGELGQALETMRVRLEGKQYVEQYVHSLTHEMKSPLAAIRGSAELLESPMEEADRARFATNIRTQSERLAAMIDKLLALAAVEHRQHLETRERVDLVPLVDEAIAHCAQRLGAAHVAVARTGEAQAWVEGDPFLLRQAVANFIENAAAFSPADSTIEAHVAREGDRVSLLVADRGAGIPDYALPRVFERFYSLPRPDGGSRSSGLGLCFVAEVAALHGGTATLGNRDGGGAAATLVLPAA